MSWLIELSCLWLAAPSSCPRCNSLPAGPSAPFLQFFIEEDGLQSFNSLFFVLGLSSFKEMGYGRAPPIKPGSTKRRKEELKERKVKSFHSILINEWNKWNWFQLFSLPARQSNQQMKNVFFVDGWRKAPINSFHELDYWLAAGPRRNSILKENCGPRSSAINQNIFELIAGAAAGKEKKWNLMGLQALLHFNAAPLISLLFPLINFIPSNQLFLSFNQRSWLNERERIDWWLALAYYKSKELNESNERSEWIEWNSSRLAGKREAPINLHLLSLHFSLKEMKKKRQMEWLIWRRQAALFFSSSINQTQPKSWLICLIWWKEKKEKAAPAAKQFK